MTSLIADLARRERDKIDFLASVTRQTDAIFAPLREQERLVEALSSAGTLSMLKMREEMLGTSGSAFIRDFTAQMVAETTKLNQLFAAERWALADSIGFSSTRISDQIKGVIEPRLAEHLKQFATLSLLSTLRDSLGATSAISRMALANFSRDPRLNRVHRTVHAGRGPVTRRCRPPC